MKYFLYARKSSEAEDRQVASIDAQVQELTRMAVQYGLEVREVLTESKSAKAPGRPVFLDMIKRIYAGEASGIIVWKLDRLARNPVDGGQINWMLQQGKIHHIRTWDRDYRPSDNVLMMSVEFGMANQFIRDLSANTKRGLKHKAASGWLPTHAPVGYLNNKFRKPDEPPIIEDPIRFPVIRKIWDIFLQRQCPVTDLHEIAVKDFKLTGRNGKPFSLSKFYEMLTNPFYCGDIHYKGEIYQGKHTPVITRNEFARAQQILHRTERIHAKTHQFAFTGMIRCGECGGMITAEKHAKTQKNGNRHEWTYYRCSRQIKKDCGQKYIREDKLIQQIAEKITPFEIHPDFHRLIMACLRDENAHKIQEREHALSMHRRAADLCLKKIDNLVDMRISEQITDQQYQAKKQALLAEKARIDELLNDTSAGVDKWLDAADQVFNFAALARERLNTTDELERKRLILSGIGSNLVMRDGDLHLDMHLPILGLKEGLDKLKALGNTFEPAQPSEKPATYTPPNPAIPVWGG